MKRSNEISTAEGRQLAVASATLGPWRAAAAVGALGGGVSLAVNTLTGDFGFGVLPNALSVALTLFFVVGGAGAAIGGRDGGARADHRIRRWAAAHPWRVAAVPAALLVVTDTLMRQILTDGGFFSSLWDGLWRGAFVLGFVGLVGKRGRMRSRKG